jgi:hypothetical protein
MNKKAQVTLEACVLAVLVVAGFLAMQAYFRTAIQGNWRSNADSFSDEQYEAGASTETSNNSVGNIPAIAVKKTSLIADVKVGGKKSARYDFSKLNKKIIRFEKWGTYHE